MPEQVSAQHDEAAAVAAEVFPPDLHDTHHLWLKASLLTVWVVVTFGGAYFARVLHKGGGQWGYWMAAQGSVLVFLAIVVFYSWAMARFERRDAQATDPGPPPLEDGADDAAL